MGGEFWVGSTPCHESKHLGAIHIYNNHMELIIPQKVDITPDYLLHLSKQVDLLNRLTLLDRQGSLTQ